MKKSQEKPIEKETRSKEDVDRGRAIRDWLIAQTKEEIAHIIEQMKYCNPEWEEYRYHEQSLRLEQHFLNEMKNGK